MEKTLYKLEWQCFETGSSGNEYVWAFTKDEVEKYFYDYFMDGCEIVDISAVAV